MVYAFEFIPAVTFSFKNPKAKAFKCVPKDSLIICAPPLLTVALPSLDDDEETYENSLNTHSLSLLSLLQFFFEELMSNQRSFSGVSTR